MRPIENWDSIEPSNGGGGGHDVPTGCYVLRLLDVIDDDGFINRNGVNNPRIRLVWDICEGEYAGMFSDDWSMEGKHAFIHTKDIYYKSAPEQFKGFITSVEESNDYFKWNYGDIQALKNRIVGCGIHHVTDDWNGEERTNMEVSYFCSANRVRSGEAKAPKDKDKRKGNKSAPQQQATQPAYNEAEVPF